jgi:hypothetical protein
MPSMMRSNVDFPQPDGPSSTRNSSSATEREKSFQHRQLAAVALIELGDAARFEFRCGFQPVRRRHAFRARGAHAVTRCWSYQGASQRPVAPRSQLKNRLTSISVISRPKQLPGIERKARRLHQRAVTDDDEHFSQHHRADGVDDADAARR